MKRNHHYFTGYDTTYPLQVNGKRTVSEGFCLYLLTIICIRLPKSTEKKVPSLLSDYFYHLQSYIITFLSWNIN